MTVNEWVLTSLLMLGFLNVFLHVQYTKCGIFEHTKKGGKLEIIPILVTSQNLCSKIRGIPTFHSFFNFWWVCCRFVSLLSRKVLLQKNLLQVHSLHFGKILNDHVQLWSHTHLHTKKYWYSTVYKTNNLYSMKLKILKHSLSSTFLNLTLSSCLSQFG